MTCPPWVTLFSMAHNFIELDKTVVHVISSVHFLWCFHSVCHPMDNHKRLTNLTDGSLVLNTNSINLVFCLKHVKVNMLVTHLCLTLGHPMDCSPLGSSVHGILQWRILEWIAIPFSRKYSQSRDLTQVSCIGDRFFTI